MTVLSVHPPLAPAACTVTVAVPVAVPPDPVAVAVYVVVAEGVTVVVPVAPNVPMPEMVTEVAFVELQLSVELCPTVIEEGFAVSCTVGAVEGADTVTVAELVAVPLEPVAVAV